MYDACKGEQKTIKLDINFRSSNLWVSNTPKGQMLIAVQCTYMYEYMYMYRNIDNI